VNYIFKQVTTKIYQNVEEALRWDVEWHVSKDCTHGIFLPVLNGTGTFVVAVANQIRHILKN
jgi:hypothetical protein